MKRIKKIAVSVFHLMLVVMFVSILVSCEVPDRNETFIKISGKLKVVPTVPSPTVSKKYIVFAAVDNTNANGDPVTVPNGTISSDGPYIYYIYCQSGTWLNESEISYTLEINKNFIDFFKKKNPGGQGAPDNLRYFKLRAYLYVATTTLGDPSQVAFGHQIGDYRGEYGGTWTTGPTTGVVFDEVWLENLKDDVTGLDITLTYISS